MAHFPSRDTRYLYQLTSYWRITTGLAVLAKMVIQSSLALPEVVLAGLAKILLLAVPSRPIFSYWAFQ